MDQLAAIRLNILDALIESEHICPDQTLSELRADARNEFHGRYLALQYSAHGDGEVWFNLGGDPSDLLNGLLNDDAWMNPHYCIDLNTGNEILFEVVAVLGGTNHSPFSGIPASLSDEDLVAFYRLEEA